MFDEWEEVDRFIGCSCDDDFNDEDVGDDACFADDCLLNEFYGMNANDWSR